MGDERKLDFIFKKSFGIVSTLTDTAFYDEIVRRFRRPVQTEDVNIETVQTLPDWNDSSNNTLFNLGSDDFASVVFTELHTSHSDTCTKNGTKAPGIYLDSTGTVALFVRLKLDKMEGVDASAIVYTKYPIDSSNTSLMDGAYQFDYNSQIIVNSSISVFKPYNYTLEYSNDDDTFYQVTNDIGNWSFDTNSGTIIFEDDPKTFNRIIDLDTGNNLYFTFVKYVGLQGIQNLIYYDKNGGSGIGTKVPKTELDISGSVIISNNLEIVNDLYIGDTLHVDSSNNRVGINTIPTSDELEVSGNVNISEKLTITNSGFGAGMCPIGTIIIWTNTTKPDGYGEWLLCDGRHVSSTDYQDLSNVLGSTEGSISLPDLKNSYTKGGPLTAGETDISFGGTGKTTDISLTEIPYHTHTFDQHSHSITATDHHHETQPHEHNITVNNPHHHDTPIHKHNLTENAKHSHQLNHTHNLNTSNHTHNVSHNHVVTETSGGHDHGNVQRIDAFEWKGHKRGNGSGGVNIDDEGSFNATSNNYATLGVQRQDTISNTDQATGAALKTNSSPLTVSHENDSGGDVTGGTNISSTTESSPTDTTSSNVGITSTDDSNVADTNRGYIDVGLAEYEDTHYLYRSSSSIDTFSFTATPQCIEIFYYIRAL